MTTYKIMVCSDTHTDIHAIVDEINRSEGIDLILHLGDHWQDGRRIGLLTNRRVISVRGNNDSFHPDIPNKRILDLEGHKLFLIHGHQFSMANTIDEITKNAKENGCNIALFGHSHVFETGGMNDILYLNPGAVYRPRGDRLPSYAFLYLGEEGEARVERVILPED